MDSLLQRTLVIVAHPDDEAGGCGALLQRIRHPMVLFATDGAPDDHWFWSQYRSRAAYARARHNEAVEALAACGIRRFRFLSDELPACRDQQLYRALPEALQAVTRAVLQHRPDTLLTLAYEGGHPDHDACSFLAHVVGRSFALPVWEMPLYHRLPNGQLACQQFLTPNGSERTLEPTPRETGRKRAMLNHYRSQSGLQSFVISDLERFRPQPAYDYTRPPHPGMLNYEAWQWPMKGWQVSREFARCLERLGSGWMHAGARHQVTRPTSSAG